MTRILVLLVLVSIAWTTQVHSQGPLFSPAPGSPVTVGAGSGNVVLIDVNGDGNLDIVTGHLETRMVAVQLGDGTGRFAAAPSSPIMLGYMPGDIELGDLNNDKVVDLGVTGSDRDTVDIFLGNGKGSFNRVTGSPFFASSSVEPYTHSLDLVDLNEDGNLDLVTASGILNTFATLLGDGRGKFFPGRTGRLALESGRGRYAITFGDVDGDRHLDLVSVCTGDASGGTGGVVMQRGDGKGEFTRAPGSLLSVPPGARIVKLADMNGDHRLDIVISHFSNRLSVLLNSGNGMFAPAPGSPYDVVTDAFGLAVADVNRDNKNDVVTATVDTVTVLLGDRGRLMPAPGSPFRSGPGTYHLTAGDINKDGKVDVVASSFEGNAVTVLLGR